jgi:nucleoside-diphosphate-sugar epimerase
MPATPLKSTVLVTGANGFIAAHCIRVLLSQSFTVAATVRSASKASLVLSTHSSHPRLSVHLVPDITAPNCYDEVLSSHPCDAILHLASPFPATPTPGPYEEDLLIPAINGTLRICEAASKFTSVKRVVLTSSFASVYDAAKGLNPGKTYTEEDWAPLTYQDGKNAPATPVAYRVSKVLAEKTAWEFVEKRKGDLRWDLTALCPGMVFGAVVPHSIGGLADLGTSNAVVWSLFDKSEVPETRAPSRYSIH